MSKWIPALCIASAAAFALPAKAQDNWPTKPVRLYVAHAPGTILDILARRVGDHLSKNIGQPVIVENKPGAGGTISQLMLLELNRSVGTEILHIPYKDAAAALTDVMGGQISMMFNWPTVIDPFVKSGQLVPVLSTGNERLRVVPDVSSAAELGLRQMVILGWSGFIAPAGISRPLLDRLNREIVRASQTPEVRGQIEAAGSTLVVGTPEAFAAEIRAEMQRAAALVKATGAKIQ